MKLFLKIIAVIIAVIVLVELCYQSGIMINEKKATEIATKRVEKKFESLGLDKTFIKGPAFHFDGDTYWFDWLYETEGKQKLIGVWVKKNSDSEIYSTEDLSENDIKDFYLRLSQQKKLPSALQK